MKSTWLVYIGAPSRGLYEIVLAETRQEAARIGAELLETHPECVELKEKPDYDQYFELGYVPSKVIYQDGLWNCCENCYQDICLEDKTESGDSSNPVFDKGLIFCDEQCQQEWEEDQQFLKEQITKSQQYLLKIFPGIELDSIEGGLSGPLIINFKFPKGIYTAGWYYDSPYTIEVSRLDLDAWRQYVNALPIDPMRAAVEILAKV